MDNYVGKRLDGRYEVQEIIGVGGMSVVYKAYDNVDDRIVAVKILKDEFLQNDDFVRRFKNESKAIAVMSHPNIVKVYDVSFGEKLQYIVMEYVDGITLKEYIQKQGAITWNDALYFTTQILRALQHAHDKGIVHRDIKPQNIMLLADGHIMYFDNSESFSDVEKLVLYDADITCSEGDPVGKTWLHDVRIQFTIFLCCFVVCFYIAADNKRNRFCDFFHSMPKVNIHIIAKKT